MENIKKKFIQEISIVDKVEDIEKIRIKYFGKRGTITNLFKTVDLKSMSYKEREIFGRSFNEMKKWAEQNLTERLAILVQSIENKKDLVDITLPGIDRTLGSLHPISIIQFQLEQIFRDMNFIIRKGYHIETEFYNFDSLNIPVNHPAREMQDTFWLANGMLLRTHTSANQVRMLQEYGAPLRSICFGRCFRYEEVDSNHENTFYQFDGLMVDKNINVSHLIGMMKLVLNQIFQSQVVMRLRPAYFPFVEPGLEIDCQCLICKGAGCRTCKNSGWIELLPCGMVHPYVLKAGGIDFERYRGFAFGLGLTRLAMMKYGIPEIRLFNSGDLRFLEQFPANI